MKKLLKSVICLAIVLAVGFSLVLTVSAGEPHPNKNNMNYQCTNIGEIRSHVYDYPSSYGNSTHYYGVTALCSYTQYEFEHKIVCSSCGHTFLYTVKKVCQERHNGCPKIVSGACY